MFVALIDTRPRPEPEPEPPRRPEVPWRTLGVVALLVTLFAIADAVGGLVAYVLLLVAVTVGCLAVDRAVGYWAGLTEHRQ